MQSIILFLFLFLFSIFHSQQPSLNCRSVTQKLYTHIRVFHPSGFTRTCICQRTNGILAPGIRSPALFPSPLAPFCFFSCQQQCSLSPHPVFLVHCSSPRLAPLRHCFARTPDGHASVYVSTLSLLYTFFASLFLSRFFYLFYFTRTYFLRRAYGASQRITFMGFPEIKRIPCRGLGAGKFRRRASNANHFES